jgi:hypothetical protein
VEDSARIQQWIHALEASQAEARERAAAELFTIGRDAGVRAIARWIADDEAGQLFSPNQAGEVGSTVGIAVFPGSFDRIRAANGSPRLAEVPPDQDAREFELNFSSGASLDILTTRETEGPGAIAAFLAKFGEGIQQVEFLVRDVSAITEVLVRKCKAVPLYSAARPGADGTRVNFFLVSAMDGRKILIELVETRQQ